MKRYIVASSDDNMSNEIKDAWFAALQSCNLEEEDVHVFSYEEANTFENSLERELNNRKVNLSGRSIVISQTGTGTMIEGLRVGGNSGGIASSLIRGVIKQAWEPVAKDEYVDYIEDAERMGDNIYIQDKYGYCTPSSAKKALSLVGAGDKTQYSGYGSQSYIDDTKVSVYVDPFGAVKVARTTLRYD